MHQSPETQKKDVVWFALNDDRPPFAFAGIWTEIKGDRGTKSKPIPGPRGGLDRLVGQRVIAARSSTCTGLMKC